MKNLMCRLTQSLLLLISIPVLLIHFSSCKKEAPLSATNLDENYFVNYDNPDDPIDHAIYNFYKRTGIPGFYSDTIARVKLSGDINGEERYKYVVLKPSYQLTSNGYFGAYPLTDREKIPAVLDLIETEVLSRISGKQFIPCLYFVDDFLTGALINTRLEQGNTSLRGFDAMVIRTEDLSSMTDDDKKMYAASLLAGFAVDKIYKTNTKILQSDFYSIARELIPFQGGDIYMGLPYMLLGIIPSPQPESIGFLSHFIFPLGGVMELESSPTENLDLRNYLTLAFRYTMSELESMYSSYPFVLHKFEIVRDLAEKSGFALPQ